MKVILFTLAVIVCYELGARAGAETPTTFECPSAPKGARLAAIHHNGESIICVYDHGKGRRSTERGAQTAHEKRGES